MKKEEIGSEKSWAIPFMVIALIAIIFLSTISYFTLMSSFYDVEEQYIEIVNDQAITEIENAINFGKRLNSYYGIESILEKSMNQFSHDYAIAITDYAGQGLYRMGGGYEKGLEARDYNIVSQAIEEKNGEQIGNFITFYPKAEVKDRLSGAKNFTVMVTCILSILVILTIIFLSSKLIQPKKGIVIVIILAMILQSVFLITSYQKLFKKNIEQSAWGIGGYVALSLEELSLKGVDIFEIDDLDSYLTSKKSYQVIDNIVLHKAEDLTKQQNDENKIWIDVTLEGKREAGRARSILEMDLSVNISKEYITKMILEMALTFIATIAIVFVITWESIRLPEMIRFRKSSNFNKPQGEQYKQVAIVLRYGNFLTSVGSYMCLAFAALMIREWNDGLFGLSAGVTAAMSVSICALAEAIGMLAAPILGKRISGKGLLLLSTTLLIFSNLACFFATTSAVVLIMRFLAGLGFAGNKQATNIMIAMGYDSREERENNLSESNAGLIGGILCGSGLGAIIAGVAGYEVTFAGAALLFLFFALFLIYFIPWKLIVENSKVRETEHIDFKRVFKLIKSKEVILYSLTVNFPVYLYMMVIVTLIPAVIQREGLPGVVLTYCNLLNGLAGLYIGVKLVNVLQRLLGRRKALFVISIAGALAILMLSGKPVVVMVIVSAIINGIVDGAGTPLASDEFLELGSIRQSIDETTALAIFSIIGFVVMAIGPVILETCLENRIMMIVLPILMIGIAMLLLIGNQKKENLKNV